MSKKNIIFLSIFYALFILLAVTFFFLDLDISKAMVQENANFLYVLLAAVGEFPIYLGPILFGIVYGFTNETKVGKLISHFVGLIATYVAFIRLSDGIFEHYLNSQLDVVQYALLGVASLLVYLLLFFVGNKIEHDSIYKIRDIALIMLIVSLSSFIMVTGIKYIWGRPRYRILSNDYSEYVNFLTIDGFRNGLPSDDYRSFPSGHTNAATSILVWGLLPARFTSKKWVKYLVNSLCVIYPLIVAISRIGIGAHYASDVLFGFGISFSCFVITYIIFKKKGWLYVRDNKC